MIINPYIYSYLSELGFMGDRRCAAEGCNALEFRTDGWCQRHRVDNPPLQSQDEDISSSPPSSPPPSPDFSNIMKPEPTFRYMAAVFVCVSLSLLVSSFFTLNIDGLMLGIILFGLGIIFELIYSNKSKTKLGESTKSDFFSNLLVIIFVAIVTFSALIFLTPLGYILSFVLGGV